MAEAQKWLNNKYSDKNVSEIRLFDKNIEGVEELTGELLIEDYVSAEIINLERWDIRKGGSGRFKGKITKVTIRNCPKLNEFKLKNNEIKEIIFESDFPNLDTLEAADNNLTEIDISKLPNLTWLNITRNPHFTKIKGLEYSTKFRNVNLLETPGFNGREYGEWKDSIKGILNISLADPLPNTWKTDLETKLNELKEAVKKVQDYENGLKNALGLNPADNLPTDWQTQLAKKNDDLTAAQKGLKEWTDKFGGKTPVEVEQENKQAVDNLQKELDEWKKLGKTPEQVENEIKELKSNPTGPTPTADQQQKIDDLIKIIEKQNEAITKYGNEWQDYTNKDDWQNEIVDTSKLNR